MEVLTLIPAASHLVANHPSARWRSPFSEANMATSSAKNQASRSGGQQMYEPNLWQGAALAESSTHQERVWLVSSNLSHALSVAVHELKGLWKHTDTPHSLSTHHRAPKGCSWMPSLTLRDCLDQFPRTLKYHWEGTELLQCFVIGKKTWNFPPKFVVQDLLKIKSNANTGTISRRITFVLYFNPTVHHVSAAIKQQVISLINF